MEKGIISIVYHSQEGHTKQVAEILARNLESESSEVNLIHVDDALLKMEILHQSDTIIFGSPTYFGNVSGAYKQFMDLTGKFWYKQLWKDKLATAFTLSSTSNGDKLNTLTSLSLFAAQHSMIWISQGVLPRFCNDEQTDGQNRMASYLGLMVQCTNGSEVQPLHPGDLLTLELFAQRILNITLKYKNLKI